MIDDAVLGRLRNQHPELTMEAMRWYSRINDSGVMAKGRCRDRSLLDSVEAVAGRQMDFINVSKRKDAYTPEMSVCAECSIKRECLSLAADNHSSFGELVGVWGGYKASDIVESKVSLPKPMRFLVDNNVIIRNHNLEKIDDPGDNPSLR